MEPSQIHRLARTAKKIINKSHNIIINIGLRTQKGLNKNHSHGLHTHQKKKKTDVDFTNLIFISVISFSS